MTTEDHFQQLLDANPDDHATRLVLADWLEERGDVRAEGYRALGVLRRKPLSRQVTYYRHIGNMGIAITTTLPADWHILTMPLMPVQSQKTGWEHGNTRREAEDAAALAFARLPAYRRAEFLNGTATA